MREAMSRPACGSVTGPRGGGRSSTATLLDAGTVARGHRIRARPGGTRAAVEKARAGRRGRGGGGRGPGRAAPGADGEGGADRGDRGGARGGPVGRGRLGGLGSGAGAGNGGRGNSLSPVRGRPWARGAFPGAVTMEGGQAGVLTSWRWARMVPRGRRQPPTGRHDGTEGRPGEWREGRRQEGGLLSPSNISRVQVHPPVPACIYIYMYVCMYVCIDRSIDAPSPPSTAGPRRTGLDVYISPRVRCCTASRQVQISPRHPAMAGRTGDGDPLPTLGTAKPGTGTPPSLT